MLKQVLFAGTMVIACPLACITQSSVPTALVTGHVYEIGTCNGVAHLVIRARPSIKAPTQSEFITDTDAKGDFQLRVQPGSYYIRIFDGVSQVYGQAFEISDGKPIAVGLKSAGTDDAKRSLSNCAQQAAGPQIIGAVKEVDQRSSPPMLDLLQVSRNLRSDPQLSATLILYDLMGKYSSHLPSSRTDRLALANLVWSNGWLQTYSIGGSHRKTNDVAISPDGALMVTAHEDRAARIWELPSGRQLWTLGHRESVRSVLFSHNGSLIVTLTAGGNVKLWNATTGSDLGFHAHTSSFLIRAIFSPDDSQLATLDNNSQVIVFRIADGTELYRLPIGITPVKCIAYDPAGNALAGGRSNGEVSFWDATSGHSISSWHDFEIPIRTLNFNRDGGVFVTAEGNNLNIESKMIQIQPDFKARRVIGKYSGDKKHVDLDFGIFDRGQLLLVGSSGSELKIWDAQSLDDIVVLRGQRNWRTSFLISSDPMKLIVWNDDIVRVMSGELDDLVGEARKHSREMSSSECQHYLNIGDCPNLGTLKSAH